MSNQQFEEMSLIEHITELRIRLLWSFVYIIIIFVVCFIFADELFSFLAWPLVKLLDTDYGSASNQTGEYIINNIAPGQYIIKAMFIGYESTEQSIIIESNNLYTININLKPSTIELQTTRVTAEKR